MARLWKRRTRGEDVLKGAAAGIIGGLAASWIMTQFQTIWMKASEAAANGNSSKANGRQREQQQEEDPTMKTADKITKTFTGESLRKSQKKTGGTLVHYAFGAAVGGLYAAMAGVRPQGEIFRRPAVRHGRVSRCR